MNIDNRYIDQIELYKQEAVSKKQIVTVFMLTHNREQLVSLAVHSVLNQTYDNFQLIILDNCSVDNTKSVICSIPDPRIRYIYRKSTITDSNPDFCRNICVSKYFIIFHDDDIVQPNYLETVLRVMDSHLYAAMSVSGVFIDEKGTVIGEIYNSCFHLIEWKKGEYFQQFFSKNSIGMIYPATIYRTEFYKDFQNFGGNEDIGPAGDQNVWFQTERLGGVIAFLNENLFQYRIHQNQDSYNHVGFMELQLLDYLLKDDYFLSFIERNINTFYNYLWRVFKKITKKYAEKYITKEKYKSFFYYNIIRLIATKTQGRFVLLRCYICYFLRNIIKIIYKVKDN